MRRPGLRPVFHAVILLLASGAALYAATHSYGRGFAQGGDSGATDGLSFPGVSAAVARGEPRALPLAAAPLTQASIATAPAEAASGLPDNEALRLAASRAAGEPLPPAAPTPTPPAEPPCDRTVSPLYCVYTVQPADTLSKIATQFGLKGSGTVPGYELLVQSNKPDIVSADDFIQPGQRLRVPLKNGIVHVVLTGETLSEIAAAFGVDTSAITDATNSLPASGVITIGQELLISEPARVPAPKLAAAPTPTATPSPEPTPTTVPGETPAATGSPAPTGTPRATRTPAAATATPRSRPSAFIWPATGPISSYFGPAHPLGIDIDLYANPNAPIVAAAAGTVTFAGGNPCCSYGLYVIVDHGNGYTTLYAHLSSINVSQGQRVTQGQLLGLGGRTGYATGNHLHFEVRYNDAVIDPLSVLP
ncbi:MAG TPA: M23 family metallopeptidase [Dehalococcoidia bacterium]|nr:M23 family metallopeptidase [Dehalococcoidia bacterium]